MVLTSTELQTLVVEHEIFMKNIDIMSKHEDNLNDLLPQLQIIVRRLSDMDQQISFEGTYAENLLFKALEVEKMHDSTSILKSIPRKKYFKIVAYIRELYIDEKKFEDFLASINSSFPKFRRRFYEYKEVVVSASFKRYSEHKLQLWKVSEERDWWKTLISVIPLLFSFGALIISAIALA